MRQQPLERVPGIANASHAAHHRRALLLPQGLLWLPIVRSLSLILKAAPESDAAAVLAVRCRASLLPAAAAPLFSGLFPYG